jgi:hypothetical protein
MDQLASLVPAVVAVIVAVFAFGALVLVGVTLRSRLVRCPETGSVALVEITPARSASAHAQVRHCDLWLQPRACTQGCLKHYSENESAHLAALRAARTL